MTPEVRDNPEQNRFEVYDGDTLAGFAEYRTRPGRIVFAHTEIDKAFGGRGIGSSLIRGALEVARARGLRVTPLCPFVSRFVDEHPEYHDLIDAPAG